MSYPLLSNQDINEKVALLDCRFSGCLDLEVWRTPEDGVDVVSQGVYLCTMNYIKNPEHAWPLIMSSRINITAYDKVDDGWFATTDTSFFVDDANPLRAAMLAFLILKGALVDETNQTPA